MSPLSNHRVYLDHNGSTPITPDVARELRAYLEGCWGNAGAAHPDGVAAKTAIELARERVAAAMGGKGDEITFTSGGTESNNAIVFGVAETELRARERGASPRNHIVAGRHEHLSVVRPIEALERRGFDVTWLSPDASGVIPRADLDAAIRPDTLLVSMMLANNETGMLQPVRYAARLAHDHGALVFVDAVCGAGKVALDVDKLGCDFLSVSGHKMHAPKGIGAVWSRSGAQLEPLIHGCGQQSGRRSGTENTMGAVALGAAMELYAAPDRVPGPQLRSLRDRLLDGILAMGVGAERNGGPGGRPLDGDVDLPNTFSVWFPGQRALELQDRLGALGLSVAAQVARPTSGPAMPGAVSSPATPAFGRERAEPEPSHVLLSMGHSRERGLESLRFSLGTTTVDEEVDAALRAVGAALLPTLSK